MPEQRNAIDIAADNYRPFDHLTTVVQPFETEGSRDVEFQQSAQTVSTICDTI